MKKIIYSLLLLIFVQVSLFATVTGSGTYLDPYNGTLNTTMTWSGRTYFNIVTVGTGGILTISAGAQIYGSNTGSTLKISGNGVLSAIGTAVSNITFSADNDGDGSPSTGPDPIETWGNILFSYLGTGNSTISYAIIENGTGDSYTTGGGIDIWGNNVTISNSTVRYCNNSWGNGGGIAVTPSGSNVILSNLIIYGNIASSNGGGIFTDGNVSISSCEIYGNSATSGAGIFLNAAGSISNSIIHDNTGEGIYSFGTDVNGTISNCIIYNNSFGIYFYGERNVANNTIINNIAGITSATSLAPKIVNTVLWGNTTQYNLESGGAMELANCGIQGGFTVGTNGGGNKTLSATNGADTGPNFIVPTTNFHINSWITPLVDGGTGSYTGVTIPGTDIDGKTRIGTIDIGAYEFLYYIWNGGAGTVTWATSGNWVGSPASIPTTITEEKVLIPKGCSIYPTVASLSLTSRSFLTIEPQAGLKVTGATSVGTGCTFLLKSDATGSANFISGSTVTGSFNIELFLAGGGDPDFKWHYVTPPVASINKSVLTTDINNTNNLLNYLENKVTTDRMTGWQWHDGFDGTTGFNTLLNTFGYDVYVATDKTALFTGAVKVGNFSNSNITFTSTDPAQSGWNLIGNPYTCGVNANNFIFGDALDIDQTIYITKGNLSGSWSVGGQAGINGVTNIIPSMQGFFVHATMAGPGRTLQIPVTSRTYTTNPLYKKGLNLNMASEDVRTNPYLKFNVADGPSTDESIIYFFPDATAGFDRVYDAYKMLAANPALPQIYSGTGSLSYGINGLPLPETKTSIPVKLRIGVAKSYTINVLDIQNLTDYTVTLIHGTDRINLKTNPSYTFSGVVGTMSDTIVFVNNLTTGINPPDDKPVTSCWYSNGSVFINSGQEGLEGKSSVTIYDLNGRIVFSKENVNIAKGETVQIPVNLPGGFYLANLVNKNVRVVKKIVVSR